MPGPARIAGTYVGGALTTTVTATRLELRVRAPAVWLLHERGRRQRRLPVDVHRLLPRGRQRLRRIGWRPPQEHDRGLLADIAFYPKPNVPLSLRVGFGAGFGRVEERESSALAPGAAPDSQVFGGAPFREPCGTPSFPAPIDADPGATAGSRSALRYPGSVTPPLNEVSMANTVLLGLWTGFFLGNP